MDAKLTINLSKNILDGAENYAKENSTSLSRLIESYLKTLTKKKSEKVKISPLVESLTGIIPAQNKAETDAEFHDYLKQKYS